MCINNNQERPNFANCENCGQRVNLLEMGPVLYHGYGHCIGESQDPARQPEIPFTARRGGEPVELINGKVEIFLN